MVDARLGKSDERRRGRRRIGGRRGRGGSRRRDEEEEKEKGEDGTDASSENDVVLGIFRGPNIPALRRKYQRPCHTFVYP